jgi:hypothetical protein
MKRSAAWLLFAWLLVSCSGRGQPLTEGLVASLDGDPVTLEQFREYLS